jgi:polysaccharide chain length determinant protein (PEP-CTERM system associated)
MLERLSVPRRAFDFEDYVDILRRNVRWLVAPAFAGLVVSTVLAYTIEDTYVSQARIRIVPQQVKEDLVQTTSSQLLSDHIASMAETIKSRNTMASMINTFGLYRKELKKEPLEDVLNIMGPAIKIGPGAAVANVSGRNAPAIQISFTYRDRVLAQKVCQDIVSRFMSENMRDRMDNLQATDQFLNDEYQSAKRQLDDLEQKLSDFRTRNAGRLPEEMSSNLAQMNALDARLGSLNDQASRNDQQRMMLESELRGAKTRLDSLKDTPAQALARTERVADLDHQIEILETNIATMKDRYTESFPDLQQARAQLAVLKKQRDDLSRPDGTLQKAESAIPAAPATRERLDTMGGVDQLKTMLDANSMESRQIAKQIDAVNTAIRGYQARLENLPVGDREYTELMRDRDFAKAKYQEMELKRQRSEISMDMENRKQGESLEVIDQANFPSTPTAPNRRLIVPSGAFVGLMVGLVLIAVREVKDTSLKNLKDARLYTQLTILGSIPLLENDLVVQRRKQMMWVGWATATLVGLAVMAGSVAHYYMNKV